MRKSSHCSTASKLLRGGNDFKKADVFNGLSSYDQIEWSNRWDWRWWLYQDLQEFDVCWMLFWDDLLIFDYFSRTPIFLR
jgi:hypothetical protein